MCRKWFDDSDAQGTPGAPNAAMTQYCQFNQYASECACINRDLNPDYMRLVEGGVGAGQAPGCWYVPCRDPTNVLIRTSDECEITELTQCSYYVDSYNNSGTVIVDFEGAVACSGPIEPSNGGGGTATPESIPWWVWLLIALAVVIVLGGLIYLMTRPRGTTTTSVPVAAPVVAAPGIVST